jgi:hypothetical protein
VTTTTHDAPVEHLDDATCRRLLAGARLGRLGFTDGAMPAIVPVTYAVRDGCAVIPARRDGALMTAVRGAVVALQVDSYLDELGPGWSVTALGPARAIRQPAGVAGIEALGLFPDDPGPAGGFVAVRLALIRGWRLDPTSSPEVLPPVPQNA